MQLEEFRKKKEAALAARKLSTNEHPSSGNGNESDSLWKQREEELQSQIKQLLASVDELHRSLNDERHNASELEQTISELREELSGVKQVHDDGLKQELDEKDAEVNTLRERIVDLEREIVQAQTVSMNNAEETKTRLEELQSLNDELTLKVQRVSDLEVENAQMKAECESLLAMQQELEQLKESVTYRERELERLEGELEKAGAEKLAAVASLKEEYDVSIQQLREEFVSAAQTKDDETKRTAELESELSDLMAQFEEMLQEREAMENEKQGLLTKSEEVQARLETLEQELIDAATIAEEAMKKKEDIEQQIQVMSEQNNALLTLKESLETENRSQRALIESLRESSTGPAQALEEALGEEKNRSRSLEKEVERLSQMDVMYSDQISDFESRCEVAEGRATELQRVVDNLREEEASLKARYESLEQKSRQPDDNVVKERNAKLEMELQSLRASMQSKIAEKDQQISQARLDIESIKEHLNSEKRRSAQLEDFVARSKEQQQSTSSSQAGNKKMDDDQDMEAAALSGGSAFKPLVGLIRSLPPPLGNNGVLANLALKVDKAVVALDARPQYRALLLLYLLLVHIFLLI